MNRVTGTISEVSPRALRWLYVFNRLTGIPLRSPIPVLVKSDTLAYLLDIARITPAERERLAINISIRLRIPFDQANKDLDTMACPVLIEDVPILEA